MVKLYLIDKSFDVVSWYVNAEVLELQTLVMRGDLEQFATQNVVVEKDMEKMESRREEIPDLSTITLENLSEEYSQLISRFTKTELNQLSRFSKNWVIWHYHFHYLKISIPNSNFLYLLVI